MRSKCQALHEVCNVYKAEVGRQVYCGQRKSDTLQLHLKLRLGHCDAASGSLRPHESPTLKLIWQQALAATVPPEHLDHVDAPAKGQ